MKKTSEKTGSLWTTILIVLIALVCITLATRAWFSIADKTRLKGANMDITTGKSLRFDLEPHNTFEEYKKSLSFDDIADYIIQTQGKDIRSCPLEPVTTENCEEFYYEDGKPADKEDYIEFTLHFRASADMHVHLSSDSKEGSEDGTYIDSDSPDVISSMRIALFDDYPALVYNPNMGDEYVTYNKNMIMFGLLPDGRMRYNERNVIFDISEGEDVPVKVRIWLEGNDPACTNAIKLKNYSIMMRFVGTDEEYNVFS